VSAAPGAEFRAAAGGPFRVSGLSFTASEPNGLAKIHVFPGCANI
jgi:hypothetical protein